MASPDCTPVAVADSESTAILALSRSLDQMLRMMEEKLSGLGCAPQVASVIRSSASAASSTASNSSNMTPASGATTVASVTASSNSSTAALTSPPVVTDVMSSTSPTPTASAKTNMVSLTSTEFGLGTTGASTVLARKVESTCRAARVPTPVCLAAMKKITKKLTAAGKKKKVTLFTRRSPMSNPMLIVKILEGMEASSTKIAARAPPTSSLPVSIAAPTSAPAASCVEDEVLNGSLIKCSMHCCSHIIAPAMYSVVVPLGINKSCSITYRQGRWLYPTVGPRVIHQYLAFRNLDRHVTLISPLPLLYLLPAPWPSFKCDGKVMLCNFVSHWISGKADQYKLFFLVDQNYVMLLVAISAYQDQVGSILQLAYSEFF